jgi:hypothetical protein
MCEHTQFHCAQFPTFGQTLISLSLDYSGQDMSSVELPTAFHLTCMQKNHWNRVYVSYLGMVVYCDSYLLVVGKPQSSIFFLYLQWTSLIGPLQKNLKI